MKTEQLQFHLPPERIAQQPIDFRSNSKLLVLNRAGGALLDSQFGKIGEFLLPGDCLVVNDTRVLPARFFGRRLSGGKVEGLFLRQSLAGVWEVMLKSSGRLKAGETIYFKDKQKREFCCAELLEKLGEGRWRLRVDADAELEAILESIGFPPLPPYIKRGDDPEQAAIDSLRYQTVYASKAGAVAAPTAGLHFTDDLIEEVKNKGVCFAHLTLHVGAGTFRPINAENIEQHQMESERFSIDEENCRVINTAKKNGGRIIAVGTTSVRTLETVGSGSEVKAASGKTELFIKPGYEFKMVDAMVTNFHLPKSTLLVLVATFAGLENILFAYDYAIKNQYRFYSYGDAMLIV